MSTPWFMKKNRGVMEKLFAAASCVSTISGRDDAFQRPTNRKPFLAMVENTGGFGRQPALRNESWSINSFCDLQGKSLAR
jgi:hypothetical protein